MGGVPPSHRSVVRVLQEGIHGVGTCSAIGRINLSEMEFEVPQSSHKRSILPKNSFFLTPRHKQIFIAWVGEGGSDLAAMIDAEGLAEPP
jgi:hypothetical protein